MLNQSLCPSKPRQRRLALAAILLCAAAAPAQAQWFNLGSGLRPEQVEREIMVSGYQLTGPITRNGGVYLADVLGPRGEPQRLLVDATDGRLLQRYRARRAPGLAQGFYPTPGEPITRPPGLVESRLSSEPLVIPDSRRYQGDQQVARTEQPVFSIFNLTPPAAPVAPAAPEIVERPKHKPAVVKRRKIDAAPVVQPAALPASPTATAPDTPAPVSSAPAETVVAPTPAAAPAAVAAPVVAAPPPVEPRVAETKAPPPVAPPVKPVKPHKPVLNDLPVNTLE